MGCCFGKNKVHVISDDVELHHHDGHKEWAYEGDNGPKNWKKNYPLANGSYQSPINIVNTVAVCDDDLERNPLKINYDKYCCDELLNNGHTFQVNCDGSNSKIKGGPLKNSYNLLQFHVHWGKKNDEGSEHLIDNKSYAAEIHFVHWNSVKYKTPSEAMNSNQHDGLAVLGVMVKIGSQNDELQKLIDNFHVIKLKDEKTKLTGEHINLTSLLPSDTKNYWTYKGSLTTPPCTQSVQWIVFQHSIQISAAQLESFRKLYNCKVMTECCEKTRISSNYRPICQLNKREIKKSFAT